MFEIQEEEYVEAEDRKKEIDDECTLDVRLEYLKNEN